MLSILKAPPKTTKVRQVLRLVMSMVQAGTALCVPGNHDIKLMRKLRGKDVQITHGLADSLQQLDKESPEGRLVVAHAGMKEEFEILRSMTRRQARLTNSAFLFATTGLRSIAAGQWWSMVTHLCPRASRCSSSHPAN